MADADILRDRYNITGFPVVDGKDHVVGIVTNRDMRFAADSSTPVSKMMTKVHLFLRLKVREKWREETERYSEMGLNFRDGNA